jgi:hypothetical protein
MRLGVRLVEVRAKPFGLKANARRMARLMGVCGLLLLYAGGLVNYAKFIGWKSLLLTGVLRRGWRVRGLTWVGWGCPGRGSPLVRGGPA